MRFLTAAGVCVLVMSLVACDKSGTEANDRGSVPANVSHEPAATPLPFKPVSWNAPVKRWNLDVATDFTVRKEKDGSWKLSNGYEGWPGSIALIDGLDIRQGAVEFEIKGSDCHAGVLSASGVDAAKIAPLNLKADERWHRVSIKQTDDGVAVTLDGSDLKTGRPVHNVTDIFTPCLNLKPGHEVNVRQLRQATDGQSSAINSAASTKAGKAVQSGEAESPDATVKDKDAETSEVELRGKELIAWKLAFQAAIEEFNKLANRISPAPGMRLSLGPTIPKKRLMMKTPTGDYIFTFLMTGPAEQLIQVPVTDLGNSFQVGRPMHSSCSDEEFLKKFGPVEGVGIDWSAK